MKLVVNFLKPSTVCEKFDEVVLWDHVVAEFICISILLVRSSSFICAHLSYMIIIFPSTMFCDKAYVKNMTSTL